MSPEDRKQLIEKCAKAMGIELDWGNGAPRIKSDVDHDRMYFNPTTNLADCAAMNAELDVETGFSEKFQYAWAEVWIDNEQGYITIQESYSAHNGNKEAAWMMASARCVAATQEG